MTIIWLMGVLLRSEHWRLISLRLSTVYITWSFIWMYQLYWTIKMLCSFWRLLLFLFTWINFSIFQHVLRRKRVRILITIWIIVHIHTSCTWKDVIRFFITFCNNYIFSPRNYWPSNWLLVGLNNFLNLFLHPAWTINILLQIF